MSARPARRSLLVLLGVVAGLLAAEAAVRAAGASPELAILRRGRFQLSANPARVYEPVPGSRNDGGDLAFFDYVGTANRLGYRDRDHPLRESPGTSGNPLRIVVLGDSVAAGLGIARTADIFPARLERELHRRGRAAEVLNFGVSGYNTRQEIETLKDDALAFAPDLVLIAYCLNDHLPPEAKIVDGLRRQAEGRVAVAPQAADRLLSASALYRLLRYRGDRSGEATLARLDDGAAAGVSAAAAFDELAALSGVHGFRVMVAVFPQFTGNLDRYPFGDRHRHLAALSEERGFAHLDLLWVYRECAAEGGRRQQAQRLALDRFHPTVEGHACAARAMAEFVDERYFRAPPR